MIGPFDISSELRRTYRYAETDIIIYNPVRLYIADSGSHRVVVESGEVIHIPAGWLVGGLSWLPHLGAEEVVL